MNLKNVENLALVGCGVRGIAEAGALSVFEKYGLDKQIKNVACVSAGAIVGTLFSCGYGSQQIKTIIKSTDFKSFEDGNVFDFPNDFSEYGLHPATTFSRWLKELIHGATGEENSTFADWKAKGFKNLVVFACNMNTQSIKRFDADLTPNIKVWEAVRCSMSIPWFFRAYKLEGDIYNDGGLVYNYPIDAFDTDGVNDKTIGIHFNDLGQPQPRTNLAFGEIKKMVSAQWSMLLNAQNFVLGKQPENTQRTICIDGLGISATDFGLSVAQEEALYSSGQEAVELAFQSQSK